MDVVGLLVERLRRLSMLAVQRQYGSPLNLRIRKVTTPPKRLWSKMTRSHANNRVTDLHMTTSQKV